MIALLFKRFADLVIGIIITTIFALTALVPESTPFLSAANIILSPLFLLFLPGYALVATMYPAKSEITVTVRYILAILWSLLLAPLLALLLYFLPFGLGIREWKLLAGILVVYLFFIGVIQRARTPLKERFQPTIWISPTISVHRRLETNTGFRQIDKVHLWLAASVCIFLLSILYAVFVFERHDPYTEFYVQKTINNEPVSVPAFVESGRQSVIDTMDIDTSRADVVIDTAASESVYDLWVVNREMRPATYTVAQKTGDLEATYVSSFTLAYDEQKQVRIRLGDSPDSLEAIVFLLFIDEDATPYRMISFRP